MNVHRTLSTIQSKSSRISSSCPSNSPKYSTNNLKSTPKHRKRRTAFWASQWKSCPIFRDTATTRNFWMSFTPRSKPKSVETLLNSFWKYCAQDNGSKLFWILKPFSTLQSYSIWSWSQSLRKSSLLCLKCLSFQLHCKNLQAQWSTPKVRLEFLQEPQFWALLQVSFSRKSRLQRSTKKEWWSSLDMRKSSETSLSITQTYSTNFTTSLHKFTKFFWRKTPKSSFWTGTMHWFKETWKKRNLALVSKGQPTQNFLMTV